MKTVIIESTKDYDMFQGATGNRDIRTQHVRKLVNSILDQNLLPANPILVNEDYVVLDGQHRLAAAKEIGLPIYYIVVRGNIDTVRKLNTNQKAWTTQDYLNSYVASGNEEYVKLQDFIEKWGIGISFAAGLLSGKRVRDGGLTGDCLRDGTFQCLYLQESDELMQWVDAFDPYADSVVRRSRSFMSAVNTVKATGLVTLNELKHKVGVWARPIPSYTNKADNLKCLEEILNYHQKDKQRFY